MTILGQLGGGQSEPERLVGFLALIGLLGLATWRGVQWLRKVQPTPEPWDETVAEELKKDSAMPLCHRCLSPHDSSVDFCPDCGTPVGQYTNWLPYPYLFSVGHVLRVGTSGEFKRSPLTITGFILLGLAEYSLFVPIYWIVFLHKLLSQRQPDNPPEQSPPTAEATPP